MSKIKRWKVLKMGIPKAGKLRDVLMACMKCGEESQLALIGSPLAQVDSGFVFDTGPNHLYDVGKTIWRSAMWSRYDLLQSSVC